MKESNQQSMLFWYSPSILLKKINFGICKGMFSVLPGSILVSSRSIGREGRRVRQHLDPDDVLRRDHPEVGHPHPIHQVDRTQAGTHPQRLAPASPGPSSILFPYPFVLSVPFHPARSPAVYLFPYPAHWARSQGRRCAETASCAHRVRTDGTSHRTSSPTSG